eukprot:g4645.t1
MHVAFPIETSARRIVEDAGRRTAKRFGFREISTPIVEFSALFNRTLGDDSDVVTKEMYTFQDGPAHRQNSLTLRPENTAGVMRALLSHHLTNPHDFPHKLFYSGPMFRRERPQRGRYRQFHQFGVELVGSMSPEADVEVISAASEFLDSLGLRMNESIKEGGVRLEINSLGDRESRDAFETALFEYFKKEEVSTLLSETSLRRLQSGNVLRILDSKSPGDIEAVSSAPKSSSFLTKASVAHFDAVQAGLEILDIPFTVNPHLVRGLEYYSHTAFEFVADLNANKDTRDVAIVAVAAGGRYDSLAEALGAPAPVPAVGWAAGMERLQILMNERKANPEEKSVIIAVGAIKGSKEKESDVSEIERYCTKVAHKIRSTCITPTQTIWQVFGAAKLQTQFKAVERAEADIFAVVGSSEVEENTVTLRNLHNGDVRKTTLECASKEIVEMISAQKTKAN